MNDLEERLLSLIDMLKYENNMEGLENELTNVLAIVKKVRAEENKKEILLEEIRRMLSYALDTLCSFKANDKFIAQYIENKEISVEEIADMFKIMLQKRIGK